jgi:hypothetical protein
MLPLIFAQEMLALLCEQPCSEQKQLPVAFRIVFENPPSHDDGEVKNVARVSVGSSTGSP